MRLFEIQSELRQVIDLMNDWAEEHDGDVSEFPLNAEMEKLTASRNAIALGLAAAYKEFSAEADAIKSVLDSQKRRHAAAEAKAERVKAFVATIAPIGEKIANENASISWRKSTTTECDPSIIPPPECAIVTTGWSKTKAKELLDARKIVIGAKLVTNDNIQIK